MPVSDHIRNLRTHVGHSLLLLPGASALVFNDANEILLGPRSDNGRWAVVGGAIDPGETPAQAAMREALEETGVTAVVERVSGVYTSPVITYPNGDIAQYVIIAFRCRAAGATPHAADEESTDVRYFALDALPSDLSPAHRQRIRDAAEPGSERPAVFA
jgi:8-oxo-dGTP pyrophosphatase MutT (NUDIX family)